MNIFWRHAPLAPEQSQLLDALDRAHEASVYRNNLSSNAVMLAAAGSRNYVQAIAAALLTLGSVHAPITATMCLLSKRDPAAAAREMLIAGKRVPGWGNAFHKDGPDPEWNEVATRIDDDFPATAKRIGAVSDVLGEAGKRLWPNPSAYTAATALIVGLPRQCASYLFIAGRLAGWSQLVNKTLTK